METSVQLLANELQIITARIENIIDLQQSSEKIEEKESSSYAKVALASISAAISSLRSASVHLYKVDNNLMNLVSGGTEISVPSIDVEEDTVSS